MSRKTKISRLLEKYSSYKVTKEELRKLLASGAFCFTGIAGPFVVRYKNNKPIISERPVNFRMSMTSAAVQGRSRFTSGIKFAKCLADIKEIKNIWQPPDTLRKTAWLSLVKYNYTSEMPGIKNTLTPPGNHFIINNTCTLTEDFRITIDRKFDLQENLHIIIVPYNPVTKSYDIIYLSGSVEDEIKLREEQINILNRYTNYIMYSAVIRTNGNKSEWSNTVVTQGTIVQTVIEEPKEYFLILFYTYKLLLYNRKILLFSG